MLQQKRLIPDLATWVQCFSLYTAIICSQSPGRITDLLGYMCQIVRASHRFKWPSWVIYDQNFRQEAAERNQTSDWARIDSSLFAQCFTGQAKSSESWCKSCHSLDHLSDACPLRPPPPKRPKAASSRSHDSEIYRCFNTGNGGCPFGVRCRYAHHAGVIIQATCAQPNLQHHPHQSQWSNSLHTLCCMYLRTHELLSAYHYPQLYCLLSV